MDSQVIKLLEKLIEGDGITPSSTLEEYTHKKSIANLPSKNPANWIELSQRNISWGNRERRLIELENGFIRYTPFIVREYITGCLKKVLCGEFRADFGAVYKFVCYESNVSFYIDNQPYREIETRHLEKGIYLIDNGRNEINIKVLEFDENRLKLQISRKVFFADRIQV